MVDNYVALRVEAALIKAFTGWHHGKKMGARSAYAVLLYLASG